MTNTRTLRPPLIQLVNELSALNIFEASELVKNLENELSVPSPPIPYFDASSASFENRSRRNPPAVGAWVRVRSFGLRRVEVIKALLRLTGWSLSEVFRLERDPDLLGSFADSMASDLQKILDEIRSLGAEVEFHTREG